LRGIVLSVLRLAAGVAIQSALFVSPLVSGGIGGLAVPAPTIFGLNLGLQGGSPLGYGLMALVVLAACCFVVAYLRGSQFGRQLLAVRANERAASAAGVDVRRTKVLAFGISAGMAGLGGALIGYGQTRLSVESFGVNASLLFLAVALVGGVTTVTGALFAGLLVPGGLLFTALDSWTGMGDSEHLLIYGIAVVVIAVLRPAGLAYRRPAAPAPAGAHRAPRAGRSGARSAASRAGAPAAPVAERDPGAPPGTAPPAGTGATGLAATEKEGR
jgi:branched-chain amino acid transport system permease protein